MYSQYLYLYNPPLRPLLLSDEVKDVPSENAEVGDVAQDANKNEDVSEKDVPEENNDVTEKDNKVQEQKEVDKVTKDLEEAALNDLDDLNSFLLQIVLVPNVGDEEKIADKPIQYNEWMEMWVIIKIEFHFIKIRTHRNCRV